LLLHRILPFIESQKIIPTHQFGFQPFHSTIQQAHRLVDAIASSLARKEYCCAAFLDIEQAFDRVWLKVLLYKLKKIIPPTYYLILHSYFQNRFFHVSFGSSTSQIFPCLAGVPQGSILGPVLFNIYTSDLPLIPFTDVFTFADDTAVISQHSNPIVAVDNLQNHITLIEKWHKQWKLKTNITKSTNSTFTLNKRLPPPVFLNGSPLPTADVVRYLGLYMDKRLTWEQRTRLKRTELKRGFLKLYSLFGRNSKLSLDNKLLLYKTVLRPMWTYGMEIWGSTKPSNSQRIQSMQSIILRSITNSPFYVSNLTLHNDLQIPVVKDLAHTRYTSFHKKLPSHPNPHVQSLASPFLPDNPTRRLKRQWPRDLLSVQ